MRPPSAHALFLPSPPPPSPNLPPVSLWKAARLFALPNRNARLCLSPTPSRPTRCSAVSIQVATSAAVAAAAPARPSPAEVSRTIMELSSTGTLSGLTPDGWPLGVGARFVVDSDGSPALCLENPGGWFSIGGKSSFHVQLEQSGSRTPQCTLLGSLTKPEDRLLLRKLRTKWEKRFGEELDEDLVYLVAVERVLCMEDIKEDGVWVSSLEYGNAEPDPLRNCAEKIVDEMNAKHSEDVQRLCSIHVDTEFQVMGTRMVWVDRLGFDLYLSSENEVFEARIPFPRQVSDEKGVKSTLNCMSHLAWEVERSYALSPETERAKVLKKVRRVVVV